jgi:anti-sigma regulatory factor (Ser/Thr protein kinase)
MSEGEEPLRHEALMHAGWSDFVEGAAAFIRDGLAADEPALVVLSAEKAAMLRRSLGRVGGVCYAEPTGLGRHPGQIIPAWRVFLAEQSPQSRRARGIGEPVWAPRGSEALTDSQRHESLLDLASDHGRGWSLLCLYDVETLHPAVLGQAEARHANDIEQRLDTMGARMAALDAGHGLSEPAAVLDEFEFRLDGLHAVRTVIASRAATFGLGRDWVNEFVLAVNEIAANSVRHGGGTGTVRLWQDDDVLVSEVRDRGHIVDPLAGWERPAVDATDGRGLWLAHQLCDLVQIRSSSSAGTVVRMHVARR